jgi:hypothetical protein
VRECVSVGGKDGGREVGRKRGRKERDRVGGKNEGMR